MDHCEGKLIKARDRTKKATSASWFPFNLQKYKQ